jgi:hypothetical protein
MCVNVKDASLKLDQTFLRFATKFKNVSIIGDDSDNKIVTTQNIPELHQIDQHHSLKDFA